MTDKIYTIGYTGRKPESIKEIIAALGATLFDIRLSPRSRVPYWNEGPLRALLGERYRHVKSLGNVNYKTGGPIQILDYAAGVATILQHPRPVVLMCACKDFHTCHRETVAKLLRKEGYSVQELP